MTTAQLHTYAHLKEKFRQFEEKEIAGHQARTRGFPTFEIKSPNISFFQKLEKRSSRRTMITTLKDIQGTAQTDTEQLLKITRDYYTNLYTNIHTDSEPQDQLLRNIKKR